MKRELESDTECLDEYFARISNRVSGGSPHDKVRQIAAVVEATKKHLTRLDATGRRIRRAEASRDSRAYEMERGTAAALMYEAFDHLCIALVLLDFEGLDLSSAADGSGLIGETVLEVLHVLDAMEQEAKRLLEFEREFHLRIDFSEPIDEREGVTYQTHRHWQDFVPGSVRGSFLQYFGQTRKAVTRRLSQRPPYWQRQTVRNYLERKGCFAMLTLFHRLETVIPEREPSRAA